MMSLPVQRFVWINFLLFGSKEKGRVRFSMSSYMHTASQSYFSFRLWMLRSLMMLASWSVTKLQLHQVNLVSSYGLMVTFAPFVGLNYLQDLRRRGKNIQIFTSLNLYSRKKQLIVKDPFAAEGIYVLTCPHNKLFPLWFCLILARQSLCNISIWLISLMNFNLRPCLNINGCFIAPLSIFFLQGWLKNHALLLHPHPRKSWSLPKKESIFQLMPSLQSVIRTCKIGFSGDFVTMGVPAKCCTCNFIPHESIM